MVRSLSWQESLFDGLSEPSGSSGPSGGGPPSGLSFDGLVRHRLNARSWVDEVTGWAPDHAALFDHLLAEAPWKQRQRAMYDRMVLEPRMVATWDVGATGSLPAPLEEMRVALCEQYRVDFDSVGVNLYRDGRDGVAWHGDNNRKRLHDPLVATVSLGERRRFLLRPGTSGSPTHRFRPGGGDLLIMGGACQHDWQHTVPKESGWAGARMSVTLRHSREGWWVADERAEPEEPEEPEGPDEPDDVTGPA